MAGETPLLGYVSEVYGGVTAVAASGQIKEGTVAVQLPTVACRLVRFKAYSTNTGDVYVGASTVSVEGTVTSTTTGWKMEPGDDTGWIPLTALNTLYTIGENATDYLNYIALA